MPSTHPLVRRICRPLLSQELVIPGNVKSSILLNMSWCFLQLLRHIQTDVDRAGAGPQVIWNNVI